jgi:cytochrome P450
MAVSGLSTTPFSEEVESLAPSSTPLKFADSRVCYAALRLIPEVPFNAKVANKDTWLPRGGGPEGTASILIKKGQIVSFWSWASHRNPEVFGQDVETFRPSRWHHLSVDAPGYMPFQPGQRVCPGREFLGSLLVI